MKIKVQVTIEGSPEAIWKVITDIENSASHIKGIDKVEILQNPEKGLVGLKWIETRTLFGKTATETMWITEAEENQYYKTRAESHGAVYTTLLQISEEGGLSSLSMEFGSEAQSFGAKIMGWIFGPMMRSSTKKALQQDLEDIKEVVERK